MARCDLELVCERAVHVLGERPAALTSDFDGTLSPIVTPPEAARLLPGVDAALKQLSRRVLVAIVSGRPVADLLTRVAVQNAVYVGNHGAELWRGGEAAIPAPSGAERAALSAAHDLLAQALNDLPGIRFEPKNLGLGVHFRETARPDEARRRILALVPRLAPLGLAPREGKMVVEMRFATAATKGTSLESLAAEYGLRGIVFVGDDLTDVDGFRALKEMRQRDGIAALAVAVLGPETPSQVADGADLCVDGPEEVAELLRRLAEHPSLAGEAPGRAAAGGAFGPS